MQITALLFTIFGSIGIGNRVNLDELFVVASPHLCNVLF